jgi:hypothetical protein
MCLLVRIDLQKKDDTNKFPCASLLASDTLWLNSFISCALSISFTKTSKDGDSNATVGGHERTTKKDRSPPVKC